MSKKKLFRTFKITLIILLVNSKIYSSNPEIIDLGQNITAILRNPENQETKMDVRDWLIFVYMAADNNLAEYALKDIEKMRLGSNNKAHVLVSIHTQRYDQKISERLVIEDKKIYVDGKIPVADSGLPKTLLSEINWALTYKAKKIMVVLWDHGNGILNKAKFHAIRAICQDNTTDSALTDVDIKNVFESVTKTFQRKIDIITFDACLMGSIEIAYAIKSSANFMIGAESIIPAKSFEYTEIIKILETNNLSPFNFTKFIINNYQKTSHYYQDRFAVSAIDLSKIWELSKSISILSQALKTLNEKDKAFSNVIKESLKNSLSFDDFDYIDLGDFLLNIQKNIPHVTTTHPQDKKLFDYAIKETNKLLSQSVLATAVSLDFKKATGLSIYFPIKEPFHYSYNNTVWANENLWPYFLMQYDYRA